MSLMSTHYVTRVTWYIMYGCRTFLSFQPIKILQFTTSHKTCEKHKSGNKINKSNDAQWMHIFPTKDLLEQRQRVEPNGKELFHAI